LPEEKNKRKGPEYETVVGFGPNLLINDLPFITRMGELCDQYGMDSISLSNTLGLAFTLFEQGILSEKDTRGLVLRWGDLQTIEELVHLTASKIGFGVRIAQGARSLAQSVGMEDTAVHVNGLEVAYHDPRGASGMALSYATSPRGACHNQSDYFLADLFGQTEELLGMEYYERHAGAEKAQNVSIHQNWRTVFNALVMCFFANVSPNTVLELVNAACKRNYSLEALLQAGERGWNLKRVINNRLGLKRENDKLPTILLKPYNNGGSAGYIVPFNDLLNAYYQARGWDSKTGYPSSEKLAQLGLDWVKLPTS
jgi:aldehyde:ferredoxin oxidoreductase